MVPRLQERYQNEIRPQLAEQLGIENPMAIPKVTKIVINMGVGSAVADKKNLEIAFDAMTDIAGQRPVQTIARKSIAGFKLRGGHAHRLQGHLASPADVRIPGSIDEHRAAASS